MNLTGIVNFAKDKTKFNTINDYFNFAQHYLEFISKNIQATIISQNENHYKFFQYKKDGFFNVTRPLNSLLMYDSSGFAKASGEFIKILSDIVNSDNPENRTIINNTIYTLQQSIGAALDALPSGYSNTARKINGDLFERLIRLVISSLGIDCFSKVVKLPVIIENEIAFHLSYQHDIVISQGEIVKAFGSVKTSSKDRIDKIFMDKFLYCKLAEIDMPHFAIFLNDVQRKGKDSRSYGINGTFLPGHFKAYSIKLNPLDGVYYCDLRPIMTQDKLLKKYIKTFDHLIFIDIWNFID